MGKNTPNAAHLSTSNDKYHSDYCHKYGHTKDRCYKKKRESTTLYSKSMVETALCVYETALIARLIEFNYVNDTTFDANIGDTSHMVNTKKYLTDTM
jgi:hypothetical protein